jgi:hypothetical protein
MSDSTSDPDAELAGQVGDRLNMLLERVKRDRQALLGSGFAAGERIYADLFDSLRATLHNLKSSEPGGSAAGGVLNEAENPSEIP